MASVSDCGADLRKSRPGIAVVHADSVKPNAMINDSAHDPQPWRLKAPLPQNRPQSRGRARVT
jgi:hypothetical protein